MVRVLVVDDEPYLRRAVSRLLKYHGFSVDEAPDGEAALKIAAASDYDVALVDYLMPTGPNGVRVLEAMRNRHPRCARVLMTALIEDGRMVSDAVNIAQVTHTLAKPFNDHELISAVNFALEKHEPIREMAGVEEYRAALRVQFRQCVDEELLSLHVQPIVQSAWPHAHTAVEFLLRSKHPMLSNPGRVLEAVDAIGAVHELGALVNRMAARWAETLPPELLLFVNLHPGQFSDPNLAASFAPLLPHAHRVVLEITERADITRNEGWERAIDHLSRAGFRFAADDLGSGFNGLRLLADLRPAFVKIDMDIVRNVHQDRTKMSLVDLLVRFANANGSAIVAEGVETQEESDALFRCGAHLLQGYLFARPSPVWPVSKG